MNQHLHIITLGVSDLERSVTFYRETLGWRPASATTDEVAFFQAGGVVLGLYPREKLAADATVAAAGSGFAGVALAFNARSEREVDETVRDLEARGARIVKRPQKAFWGGYSAYFADPDGYLWEVAHNPFFPYDEKGNLRLE